MAIELGDGVLRLTADPSRLEAQLQRLATSAGRLMLGTGIAITAALTSSVTAAASFESAFAGVKKTLDATTEQFSELSLELRELAEIVPITPGQLARIAELGGQLNIPADQIVRFTRVMADLRVATNLTSDDQLMFFTQLAGVLKVPVSHVRGLLLVYQFY